MTAHGVQAALKEAGIEPGAAVEDQLDGPDQAELFAEDMRAEASELVGEGVRWDGKGRKPGSRNRTTARVIEFIQASGRDPLIFWSSILSMSVDTIVERFGFVRTKAGSAKMHAAEFQRKCAADLAPYLHSRKPQALTVEETQRLELVHVHFKAPEECLPPTIDGSRARFAEDIEAAEEMPVNQGLIGHGRNEVTRAHSHTDGSSD